MLLNKKVARFNEVIYPLTFVGNLECSEQNQLFICRKSANFSGFLSVSRLEQIGIDGVRDVDNGMSCQQGTLVGLFLKPLATCDEGNRGCLIELLLLLEHLVGQILFPTFIYIRAMMTFLMEFFAIAGMVADACAWPHVVHGPDNGFSGLKYPVNVIQGKHALVYPMQMDDICLLEFGQSSDVGTGIGDIDGKEMMLLEVIGFPDDDSFPNELPNLPP